MSSPLAAVGSIKVKLGLLVVASVVVAMVISIVAYDSGVPLLLAFPVTVALALGVTQLLAVGMTSPLREMTEATRRMAGATTAAGSGRSRRTRWASWPAPSTRWPPSWPPSIASSAPWSPRSPTSCGPPWPG